MMRAKEKRLPALQSELHPLVSRHIIGYPLSTESDAPPAVLAERSVYHSLYFGNRPKRNLSPFQMKGKEPEPERCSRDLDLEFQYQEKDREQDPEDDKENCDCGIRSRVVPEGDVKDDLLKEGVPGNESNETHEHKDPDLSEPLCFRKDWGILRRCPAHTSHIRVLGSKSILSLS